MRKFLIFTGMIIFLGACKARPEQSEIKSDDAGRPGLFLVDYETVPTTQQIRLIVRLCKPGEVAVECRKRAALNTQPLKQFKENYSKISRLFLDAMDSSSLNKTNRDNAFTLFVTDIRARKNQMFDLVTLIDSRRYMGFGIALYESLHLELSSVDFKNYTEIASICPTMSLLAQLSNPRDGGILILSCPSKKDKTQICVTSYHAENNSVWLTVYDEIGKELNEVLEVKHKDIPIGELNELTSQFYKKNCLE